MQPEALRAVQDTNLKNMDDARLERFLTLHRGHLTKFLNLMDIIMTTLRISMS